MDFRSRPLVPVTAVIIGLLVVLAYFGQAVRLGGISSADEHAVLVLELVNVAAVLVVPMLLIAGADVTDFGGELASGIAWSVRQSRRAVTLTLLWPALAAAPVLGVITLMAKARPFPRGERPFPVLALAGLLFWLLSAGQIALGVVRTPQPVESVPLTLMVLDPGPPVFNFRAPEACASGAKRLLSPPGTAGAAVASCQGLPYFLFEIWTSPGEWKDPCVLPRMVLHREGFARVRYAPAPDDGKWQTCAVNDIGDHQHGAAWT